MKSHTVQAGGALESMNPRKVLLLNIIGTTAAILSSISFIPQVYTVLDTRDISALATSTYVMYLCTSVLWLSYHYLLGTFHGAVSASFGIVNASIILYTVITIRYFGASGVDNQI